MTSSSINSHNDITENKTSTQSTKNGNLSVSSSSNSISTSEMPHRFVFVFHCFLSFVICNIDRINLSVAILPMAQQYSWNESTKGLIQSAFFLGYMTTQVAGGIFADARGGRLVLAAGVFVWSLCTVLTPPATSISLITLLLTRALLGVGEGVAMPAMNAIVASTVPTSERARSLSFIYSGMYAGSIVGLLITPSILNYAGWPAVFYVFGIIGLAWVVLFLLTTPHIVRRNDYMQVNNCHMKEPIEDDINFHPVSNDTHLSLFNNDNTIELVERNEIEFSEQTPSLREIMSKTCVWAIIVAHFCCTWGYFVLLTWLPSYLNSQFSLDVTNSSLLSCTPWVAMFIFANIGGMIADKLLEYGISLTTTRKIMQSLGFLGPIIFLTILCFVNNVTAAVTVVTAALAFASFSQSGVYANHQDIGPHIAGTLLGISNTFASLPGLIGVYVSGVILDQTNGNWNAVFALAILFYTIGLVLYNLFATSVRQW